MFCYEPGTDKWFLFHLWGEWEMGVREIVVPLGTNYEITVQYRKCSRCKKLKVEDSV